jgi:hypothetical protein
VQSLFTPHDVENVLETGTSLRRFTTQSTEHVKFRFRDYLAGRKYLGRRFAIAASRCPNVVALLPRAAVVRVDSP